MLTNFSIAKSHNPKRFLRAGLAGALVLGLVNCALERNWQFTPAVFSLSQSGDSILIITQNGELLVSENRGLKWEKPQISFQGAFLCVASIDRRRSWGVTGLGAVVNSTDGGWTWAELSRLQYDGESFAGPFNQVVFLDDLHGWIVDPFSIWRTEDGGKNWRRYFPAEKSDPLTGDPQRCHFIDASNGWLCGTNGIVYITIDGGKTWRARRVTGQDTDLKDVFFLDKEKGWAGGSPSGGLYRTNDGGETWQPAILPAERIGIFSVYFSSANEGWAVGSQRSGADPSEVKARGIVLHTIDGGDNWKLIAAPAEELLYHDVSFSSVLRGWLVGSSAAYQTDNGGRSWVTIWTVSR